MSSPIITVEHLSKRYHLGQIGATTLRDSVERFMHRLRPSSPSPVTRHPSLITDPQDFWALKDVSFEVNQGEVLGIIGRNGAGKSTLLKILSRITEPTSGRAVIRGRVASLLEVGTGFHPELSGRENIFLNGAILGMRHAEIARKFDEIVAFAEVDKFIDTPVKHYSSGMYVRLAFAVAAHLEPEILLVDEVLAVGDTEFQSKCMGKMGEVAKKGRTVIFVSHNMAAVQQLCGRCLGLKRGGVTWDGRTEGVIAQYLADMNKLSEIPIDLRKDREGSGAARIVSFQMRDRSGRIVDVVPCGSMISFEVGYKVLKRIDSPVVYIGIYDHYGAQIINVNTMMVPANGGEFGSEGILVCDVPKIPLPPGRYMINIAMASQASEGYDRIVSVANLTIVAGNFFGTGYCDPAGGKVFLHHKWFFSR